ncbi:MAG: polymer-forming cytoskeletal protein [Woeseiaceae bacterium]|nr:polymer-forming cytoskeletal protein [Woeseiaceae bacterium]
MSEKNKRRIRDTSAGPGTLISEGCKIKGSIKGAGQFMVSGIVEGDCDIEGLLTLADTATWRGTINADSVIVAGTVEGDIHATGRVEIADTARISGTVAGDAIAVAEGAVVEGVMQTTGRNEPTEFVEKRQDEK